MDGRRGNTRTRQRARSAISRPNTAGIRHTWPGLILAWRKTDDGIRWAGRAVYAVTPPAGDTILIEAWLDAAHLQQRSLFLLPHSVGMWAMGLRKILRVAG